MIGDVFHEIIPRSLDGEAARGSATFTTCADGQTTVDVKVLQRKTDSPLASHAQTLATLQLVGIAPMPAAEAQIIVTFHLSTQGVLTVSAVDSKSGKKQVIAVDKTLIDAALG